MSQIPCKQSKRIDMTLQVPIIRVEMILLAGAYRKVSLSADFAGAYRRSVG